ncbi:MAG: T9SS type A sorting domain-containing protein [Chitinophagaceae bacterium]|jgi:hypothetical protein
MKTSTIRAFLLSSASYLLLLLGSSSLQAQAVFNVNSGIVGFLAANKFHKVGTNGSAAGNVTLYTDVITVGGQRIDCIVRTVSVTNGVFELPGGAPNNTIPFDYSSATGSGLTNNQDRFFSPMLSFGNGGGNVRFRFEFILGNSYNNTTHKGTPVILKNVVLNTYDIDGNGGSNSNQYNEFGGFFTYTLSANPATKVAASYNTASGLTKFRSTLTTNSTVATADPHRVMVKYDEVSILDIMVGADAANGAYFMLDFSTGPAWGGTVTTVSTPSLDLNPATPGNNFTSSSCGTAVRPITSGSASQSLTGSSNTINEIIISYDPATILNGSLESLFPNGSTNPSSDSIKLNFTGSSSQTFTLNGVSFTVQKSVVLGENYLRFSKTGGGVLTTAQAEMLLDALMYINRATPPNLSYREFFISVREGSFTSPVASFIINEICILPMRWIDFQVKSLSTHNQIQFSWKLVNENSHKGFFVEYSADGSSWEDLGYVPGRGRTEGESHYSFTMGKVISGSAYFRIRQEELNGQPNFSSVKQVEIKSGVSELKIWPNPVTDLLYLHSDAVSSHYRIVDAQGRIAQKGNLQLGVNKVALTQQPKGMYTIVQVDVNGGYKTSRFIKL